MSTSSFVSVQETKASTNSLKQLQSSKHNSDQSNSSQSFVRSLSSNNNKQIQIAIGFSVISFVGLSIYFAYKSYFKSNKSNTSNKSTKQNKKKTKKKRRKKIKKTRMSVDTSKIESSNNTKTNNNITNTTTTNDNNKNNNNNNSENNDKNSNINTNTSINNTNGTQSTNNSNNNNNNENNSIDNTNSNSSNTDTVTTNINNNNNSNSNNNSNDTKNNSNTNTPPTKKKTKKRVKNKDKNDKNNNNKKESDSDEDDVKISGKKDDSGLKTSSSYYHFKSTDPKEAEKFRPKKLETTNAAANASTSSISGASAWNTGATMETFDYTQWVIDQIKLEMVKITFNDKNENNNISITEVDSIDGHATILYSRGKFRPGFDFNLKLKYSGKYDDKDVEGTITMNEVCMDDDEDDWEYEVSSKKGGSAGKKAARIVKNYRDTVISVLHVIFEEFKNKKK